MKRTIICALLLASFATSGVPLAEGVAHCEEFEATIASLLAEDVEERILAVQNLSGWALDGELRREALALLESARFDSERRVVLQAEVALASLTGGDRAAIRAAYGIMPPDLGTLSREALEGEPSELRLKALVALSRWHGRSAIPTLLAASEDRSPAVRRQALELLQELDDGILEEPVAVEER